MKSALTLTVALLVAASGTPPAFAAAAARKASTRDAGTPPAAAPAPSAPDAGMPPAAAPAAPAAPTAPTAPTPSAPDAGTSSDAAAAPALPSGTPADDIAALDLEELLNTRIASVSRREERTSQAPAAVFVVTGDSIRRQGFRGLDDVLRTVPGMFVSNDTIYSTVGVRGMAPLGDMDTRLLVLVDGHPLNNSVGIGQSYTEHDLPVDLNAIERVEVIKGPVGSIYGPVAYLGAVNIVTRAPGAPQQGDLSAGGEVAQARPNAGDLSASYLGSAAGLSWSLNVGLRRDNGLTYRFASLIGADRDVPIVEGSPPGTVAGADHRWSQNVYGTLRYGDFSLALGWWQRQKSLPTAPYSTLIGDPRNVFYNRTGFAQLTWKRNLREDLELYARLGYDDFNYQDNLEYLPPPGDNGEFYDHGRDRWASGDVRATWTPFKGHRDVLGVEVARHSTSQRSGYRALPSKAEDPLNGFGVGDILNNFTTLNSYLLVEQSLLDDRLMLQGGLTFFFHQVFGGRLTPKLAAVYRASDDDTIKALYTEGFRPPTMFEAFFTDDLDFIANRRVQAETVRQFELGYERRFAGLATAGASAYLARYDDLIRSTVVPAPGVVDPNPNDPTQWRSQFQNGGYIDALGADLYFTAQYKHWFQAYGGIAAQMMGASGGQAELANFAPLTANAALSSNALYEPLWLSLNAAFVSGRTKDPASVVLPSDRFTVDPYLLLNASARFEAPWVKGLIAQLSIYNLLNWKVIDPIVADHAPLSEVQHAGRSFRLSLEYRL